jgi:chitodextrinase
MLVLLLNVVAACSSGGGGGSAPSSSGGIDTASPSVPQALVATAASPNQIKLTWTASTDNVGIAGYRIYRAGTLITTTNSTAYTNSGLSPNTSYAYTVCAYDAANNVSAQSNAASATTPVLTPPDTQAPTTPSGLMATPVSSSRINLTWNASTDNVGVTGYNVYRGGSLLTSVTTPAFNNTGLSASTQYCYTISAYDGSNNESSQSTFVCATTPALPDTQAPTVPAGLAANAVAPNQINLTWNASTDNVGVTGYNVYRGGTLFTSVTAPALNNAGLSASTQYCYTVSAYDGANPRNESGQSAPVCATTPALPDTQAPTVPTGLAVDAIGPSQIDLTWNTSTDNVGVIGYKIYRGGAYFMTITGTSTQNTGLSPNTQYCYTISAIDAAGNESAQTSSVCDTTEPSDTEAPTVPTGLTVNAVAPNQINLTWTASTDNVGVVGYKIYRDSIYFTTVTATSAQNTELSPLTSYCYRISAVDAVNNESAQTAPLCATTPSTYSMLTGQWWVIMLSAGGSYFYVDATLTQFGASPSFQMQGSGHNYETLSNRDFYYPVSIDSTNSTFNDTTKAVNFVAYTDATSAGCGIYVVNAPGTVSNDYSTISGGAWSEAAGTLCANSGPSWTAKRVPDMSGTWWANLAFGATTYSYDIRLSQIGATMTVNSIMDHGTSSSVSFTTGSGLHDPNSATGAATLEIAGLPCPSGTGSGKLTITGNINAAATAYTVTSAVFAGCTGTSTSTTHSLTRQ